MEKLFNLPKAVMHLLREHHGLTPEELEALGLASMSGTDLVNLITEQYPDVVHPLVAAMFVSPMDGGDPWEWERRQAKDAVRRELDPRFDDEYASGIPDTGKTFEGLGTEPLEGIRTVEEARAVKAAKEAVERWVKGVPPHLLTLAGTPGVGKSHLAEAAAKALAERGEDVAFRREVDLFGEIQGAMRDSQGTEPLINAISEVKWLIIDDLGVPALKDWGSGQQDRIIDARWSGAGWLHTLITTNFKSEDLNRRVASRLGDVRAARVVQIQAPDYRRRAT